MTPRPLLLLLTATLLATSATAGFAAPARTAEDYELIEAAYGGLLPRVRQLLNGGAHVDAQDEYGYTALHWAAQAGWPLTSRALLEKGATVDLRDVKGRTPLLLAVVRKHGEVARVLLAAGADPNARDSDGNSPLEYARRKQMQTMVAMMMAQGREPRLPAHPTGSARPTPRPTAHATPPATPRPTPVMPSIRPPATPKPTPRPTPHLVPTAHPTVAPTPQAGATVTLPSTFREEVARLYGLYTDHIGMRDPELLAPKGYNQELEDKLEQIFHTLDYGSTATLSRTRLHDARAWVIAARERGQQGDAKNDRICNQILESLEQQLANLGY